MSDAEITLLGRLYRCEVTCRISAGRISDLAGALQSLSDHPAQVEACRVMDAHSLILWRCHRELAQLRADLSPLLP